MNKITINDLDRNGFVWSDIHSETISIKRLRNVWNFRKVDERVGFFSTEKVQIERLGGVDAKEALKIICAELDYGIDPEYVLFNNVNNDENINKLGEVLEEIFKGQTYLMKKYPIDPDIDYKGE